MTTSARIENAATGDRESASREQAEQVEQLGSFEDIVASAPGRAVPDEVRHRFESAHRVDLATVRVHAVPKLAEHGIRGLSRGVQVVLASLGDGDALDHELGHVVDTLGADGAPPNTAHDGLPLADDPAREARADELAAKARSARQAPVAPAELRKPQPATTGAPRPKLTNRTAITRNVGGTFDWMTHKTVAVPKFGGTYEAEGLGAVLSTTVKLTCNAATKFGQLEHLVATVPPQYVDPTRPALPEPAQYYGMHHGAYVMPGPLLGAAIPDNLLYLPTTALAELKKIQTTMIDVAQKGPTKLEVRTKFGGDGLADHVVLRFSSLDRITGVETGYLDWNLPIETDRTKWGTAVSATTTTGGAAPVSAEWRTKIVWNGTHATGDGVHVIADKLGPDHPLGSGPNDDTAKKRVDALEAAARPATGKGEPYIAGHLLNDHLGGPGNLSANLAPIPMKANSQMTKSIEKPAKRIVNDERGWIRYEVQVKHKTDAVSGLDYPSRIEAKMAIYDSAGKLQNPTTSTIDIDAPSEFQAKTAKAPVAKRKLRGNALESSPVMLDEVVLSHENDLRPFLRDSDELYELLVGSGIHAHVEDPNLAVAWRKTMESMRDFERAALPDLNVLQTVTAALGDWAHDPIAYRYLESLTVGGFKAALQRVVHASGLMADIMRDNMQSANVVLKKELAASDLFRNAQLLALAANLVSQQPDPFTLLQVVSQQQQATIPFRNQQREQAKTGGNVVLAKAEDQFRHDFQAQPKATFASIPTSPVHVWQEYGQPAQQLISASMYGAEFISKRAPAALAALHQLALKQDTSRLGELARDPTLAKSERLKAILAQLVRFVTDEMWTTSVGVSLRLEQYFAENKVFWLDSLEMLGIKEPEVGLRLYQLLGVA